MISFINRILLGQSRDGIVFSTDDYFHHQDGYRYNVNQLGDAHDWNQNRGLFWAKSLGCNIWLGVRRLEFLFST